MSQKIYQLKLSTQAAVAAKEKLKAFKIESKRRRSSPGGDALHLNSQEKAVKQSRRRTVSSLQSGENDRALKPKQQSDEEPKLRSTEGQQDSDPSKASLVSTVLRKALHQLNQLGKQDSDHSLPGDKPLSIRVQIPRKMQPSHDSRRDPFVASSSGQGKRKSKRFARSSKKKKGLEVDSAEGSPEQAEAEVPEPGSGAKSEGRKQGALVR